MEKEIINFELNNLYLKTSSFDYDKNRLFRGIHNHRAIELIKVDKGTAFCHLKNTSVKIKENQVLLINSYTFHHLELTKGSKFSCMQIDVFRHLTKSNVNSQTHFDIFNSFKNSVDYFLDETKTLLTLFKNLNEEFSDKKTGYEYYIRGYVLQLVAFMQRKGVLSINNSDSVLFNKLLPVINYIDENYNKKFSLDELGQLIFVDKYSLCRLFKKLTNSTVIDYVNFVKIQMVEEMLLFTEKSITEVAFLCGFNSMQHFNKVFKDYFEMSPTAFKKHLKAL